jgi:CBS domain-containing protein
MHSFRDLDLPQPTEGLQMRLMQDAVSHLNVTHPVNVQVDDSVARAIELMRQHSVGCALVLDGEKLAGIFTERDALFKLAGSQQDLSQFAIHHVMTPDPAKLNPQDSMATALNKMSVGGFRHLPVVGHDGVPLGLISIKDILGYIYDTALRS